jgi:hypothetical protein
MEILLMVMAGLIYFGTAGWLISYLLYLVWKIQKARNAVSEEDNTE